MKSKEACQPYLLKKSKYVPGLVPGAEENLLPHITTTILIVGDLRIDGWGSLLNLKDGDDFAQID